MGPIEPIPVSVGAAAGRESCARGVRLPGRTCAPLQQRGGRPAGPLGELPLARQNNVALKLLLL
jgi:hypothetical protein